ncbi:MAG: arginine--tRNA ligase [Candidatus Roizmanbacteria bacterium]|nr:arginine--tRNA ligase [Candidatus Roizmanbacteria bacterium]
MKPLQTLVASAVETVYGPDVARGSPVQLIPTDRPEHGDYATNIAMQLARALKKAPLLIAQEIADELQKTPSDIIKRVAVAPPGYVNITLDDATLMSVIPSILNTKEAYGTGEDLKGKRIMIEFGHPNPFKVMHIGHLRNFCIGESLVRLLESQGAKLIRTNYQGDVGMHVAKNIWAFRKDLEKGTELSELSRRPIDERVRYLGERYVEGATAFEEDEQAKEEIMAVNAAIYTKSDALMNELWQLGISWSLEKFHEVYQRLDTRFDREYMESETVDRAHKAVEQALEKGILTKSDGAVIFDGSPYNLDTRVFLNGKGFLTYEGKELGLAQMEFSDFGTLDQCIHNVAVEQRSFFAVTFKVEELLWPDMAGKQYHNAYEFVGLKSGKMSSRKGSVVTAESILETAHTRIAQIVKENGMSSISDEDIDAIAVGAVKYSYLKMSPYKYLAFDLEASLSFKGDAGPYLQYTYARAKSVLSNQKVKKDGDSSYIMNPEERNAVALLERFPGVVVQAAREYSPQYIASYLNALAQAYNTFYAVHRIIGAKEGKEAEVFRLSLTSAIAQVLRNGLYWLGIPTVEKM